MNDVEWIGTLRNVETGEAQGFTVLSSEAQGYSLSDHISNVEYRINGKDLKNSEYVWKVVAIEEVPSASGV